MKKTSLTFVFLLIAGFAIICKGQIINLNQTFLADTTLKPFSNNNPVYSLKMNGSVKIFSDSSLVRVVLIDDNSNQYLIYEAYPLITISSDFSFRGVCDETCFLNGVVPDLIRIDVINASVTLDTLNLDLSYIANASELQTQAKLRNDSDKIATMNRRISDYNMFWHAGRTSQVEKLFYQKEQLFGNKFNLMGFEYYNGGIFEWTSANRRKYLPSNSDFVSEFDWRNRHGANNPASAYYDGDVVPDGSGWLTPKRDQGGCGTCFVFSPVGSVEARLNLFYNIHDNINPHHADINISEQDVWKCPGQSGNCADGGYQSTSFDRLIAYNQCQDADYTYNSSPSLGTVCLQPPNPVLDEIKIESVLWLNSSMLENDLKEWLITKGPISIRVPLFPMPYNQPPGPHFVVLSGYNDNAIGDVVYKAKSPGESDIVLDESSSLIGTTTWYFKNSWGEWGVNGFGSLSFSDFHLLASIVPSGNVYWENHDVIEDVQFSDEDHDGYYWWGIGPKPPDCPGDTIEEDCNDWNNTLGPYNTDPYSPTFAMYQCTDNCTKYNDVWEVPLGTFTIPSDYHLQRDVVIPNGSTLVINTKIWISPDVEIRVNQGGTLELGSSAILTTVCNELWQGIIVYGSEDSQNPLNQGKIVLLGDGDQNPIIENAVCAIKTEKCSNFPESGGIINAHNAIFRNNRTAISLMAYSGSIESTLFQECSFEADSVLIDNSLPEQLVLLTGLSNSNCVQFEGCTFTQVNQLTDIIGIRAHNSYFTCKKYETASPQVNTMFGNLYYGAYVTSDQIPGVPFRIEECSLNNNYRGVYASAITSAHVLSNTFNIPLLNSSSIPIYGFTAYGLYLDNCNIYHVENNIFNSDSYSDHPPVLGYVSTCGTFINNSGPYENEIYRNSYLGLHCALAAYRFNRNADGAGLSIKCNTFTDNGMDIGVFKGSLSLEPNMGIKSQQGFENTGNDALSAGNVFTSSSFPYHTWDINNYTNQIQYNHHNHNSTILKVKPDADNVSKTNLYENIDSRYNQYSCPSHLNNDGFEKGDTLKNELALAEVEIESVSAMISAIEDGGNTDSLNLAIYFSLPPEAYDLYSDILEKSPYISDSVMKSAIGREDIFPNAMIRDILVANPHSSKVDSVMVAIDNRFIPMPDSMYAEILDGQSITDAMDLHKTTLKRSSVDYERSFNELLNIYLCDTLHSGISDSINNLLQSDCRLYSKYRLALRYLESGNTSFGDNIITSIPETYSLNPFQNQEYEQFTAFYNCKKRAEMNSNSLTFDSIQVQILFNIIESDTGYRFFPTVLCRNALHATGFLTYSEPLLFDSELKLTEKDNKRTSGKPILGEYLRIWPNPARDYVIIDYKVKPNTKKIRITLTSINGKIYDNFQVINNQSQKVYSTAELYADSYIVALYGDDKLIQSKKLFIHH